MDFSNPNILDKSKYGTTWYSNEFDARDPVIHTVSKIEDLQAKIDAASNGDIIVIEEGNYTLDKSLMINKTITVKSTSDKKPIIAFIGDAETPLFSLQPKGKLTLDNLSLKGNGTNYAFASLKEGMSNHFGLSVSNSEINDFDFVLKAYIKERQGNKLKVKWTRPFRVMRMESEYICEVEDLIANTSSLIHITRLKMYSDKHLDVTETLLDTIVHNDPHYQPVTKILDLRYNGDLEQYQVRCKWRGFADEEPTWEPFSI